MTTVHTPATGSTAYSLGTTAREYDRLRRQAQVWEPATELLLDRIDLPAGSRCLDAGSGPGVTMRQLARRVGPQGRVVGVDIDGTLGTLSLDRLRADGYRNCEFHRHDLLTEAAIPAGPYDVVYARLLLFHLPQRLAVLAKLWDAVAPGGCLVVQDYDLTSAGTMPTLDSVAAVGELILGAFTAAGCEVRAGVLLPRWFSEAGIGSPDGTEVAGRLDRLAEAALMFDAISRSLLPVAVRHGLITEPDADALLAHLHEDARADPDRPTLWPLLLGAWKHKDR
jgi:trans-aconitate methyltransferase